MSVYVLRYGDLLKIGYSSDLPGRVKNIIWSIPGDVSFVGHMPGDESVEAHLHLVFEASRFSGEWFRETDDLRRFCEIALIKDLPSAPERVHGSRKSASAAESRVTKDKLRAYAAQSWPADTHAQRIKELATVLGWRPSRVKDFYHGDARAVLRSSEASDLALWIAPELAAEAEDTDQSRNW